ncbi:NUDIX hydrolase [Microlunatus speluncae]|uniref:NUDIX hydrolase n=1 Tax=Microlunatus speluncae TaxID=2594267 RepID=UPI0012665AF9|nr:NUDIX hydrolase [Microlunatus speluncae]
MAGFEIAVETTADDSATLRWNGALPPASLEQAVSAAADDALIGRGLRRLEVTRPADDHAARRALLRAGFRQEGIRRQAVARPDGDHDDMIIYGRLAADQVRGPDGFSGVMNSALPRKRLIAHVVFRDRAGRVLLCQTTFKTDWELPGGIVEPFESPRDGAIREVREELGVDRTVGRLLAVDWLPPYLGWDDACELIFDGGTIEESELEGYVLEEREIVRVRLCTLDEAAELLTEGAHRRLTAACTVGPGETAYTEHGRRV